MISSKEALEVARRGYGPFVDLRRIYGSSVSEVCRQERVFGQSSIAIIHCRSDTRVPVNIVFSGRVLFLGARLYSMRKWRVQM